MKKLFYRFFKKFPVTKNKIIFFGYYGAQYGCNPKYLSEYILNNQSDLKVVWALTNTSLHLHPKVKKVRFASLKFWYELATSKVIITNYRLPLNMKKRSKQIYIQTWHSSLRLKKIEKDAEKLLPLKYIEQAKKDSAQIDFLLSGCAESTRIFREAFWYNGKILEIGTPRIDPIINRDTSKLNTVKFNLGIKYDEKVLLYAPTFRNDNNYSVYLQDFDKILDSLKLKFGGVWKVVVRLHPHLIQHSEEIIKNDEIINASSYNDIQELLMVSDFLITDYSSLMFDFLYSVNPVLLYLPDLEYYTANERELYFEVSELPFLKAFQHHDIIESILSFDKCQYGNDIERFKRRIHSVENGDSAKKLIEILERELSS